MQITSSLEAGDLKCHAGSGGFIVNKRIGIGKIGRIDSIGRVKIGSIFSKMRDLPEIVPYTENDTSIEKFLASLEASFKHTEGLMITSEDDILIDNLQGVVTLHTSRASKIVLHTVESARMVINAPNAHVSLNLKSIHDLSHIHCASAEIIVGEGFNKCHIFD